MYPARSAAINTATTTPITIEYPTTGGGAAEILSVTAGESNITVANGGIYDFDIYGTTNVTTARPIPIFEIYENADTIGTDAPIGRAVAQYERYVGIRT